MKREKSERYSQGRKTRVSFVTYAHRFKTRGDCVPGVTTQPLPRTNTDFISLEACCFLLLGLFKTWPFWRYKLLELLPVKFDVFVPCVISAPTVFLTDT